MRDTRKILLSVVMCTHNPNLAVLELCLQALQAQTLDKTLWEFIVVDNASSERLRTTVDINWHPRAKWVDQTELGLTKARIRGFNETASNLTVFVGDDNILSSDYLMTALEISRQWPMLGAWGGIVEALFEQSPPDWFEKIFPDFACQQVLRDVWSNNREQATAPCGAGMCVRSEVLHTYAMQVAKDPIRLKLDRLGKELYSCGDTDLALTACDLGLGTARFRSLKLQHWIGANRMQEDYLLDYAEKMAYSNLILHLVRNSPPSRRRRLLDGMFFLWDQLGRDSRGRKFYSRMERGRGAALKEMRDVRISKSRRALGNELFAQNFQRGISNCFFFLCGVSLYFPTIVGSFFGAW